MPYKPLIRSTHLPYHVTARVNNREAFPIPLTQIWDLIAHECLMSITLYEVEIHSLVLMPNHFHMLLTVPNETHDLGKVMNRFMSELTISIHRFSGRSGRVFGRRYYWSLIKSPRYFGHALKYVFRNPVRAKLCDEVEEYEFSTLRGQTGFAKLPFPIYRTRTYFEMNLPDSENQTKWLDWLNRPFPIEAEELIQKSLRKREIDALFSRQKRKPEKILEDLI